MGEPQTTNMDRFQALGVILLLASAIPQVRASLTSDCVDTDNGAIGKYNIGCTVIDDGNTNYCGGIATDDDFVAGEMCCAAAAEGLYRLNRAANHRVNHRANHPRLNRAANHRVNHPRVRPPHQCKPHVVT